MGSAFATCFGYWLGISGLLWVISYVCNTRIAMTQLLNLLVKIIVLLDVLLTIFVVDYLILQ
jgi:hypothetical protein